MWPGAETGDTEVSLRDTKRSHPVIYYSYPELIPQAKDALAYKSASRHARIWGRP